LAFNLLSFSRLSAFAGSGVAGIALGALGDAAGVDELGDTAGGDALGGAAGVDVLGAEGTDDGAIECEGLGLALVVADAPVDEDGLGVGLRLGVGLGLAALEPDVPRVSNAIRRPIAKASLPRGAVRR